MITHCLDTCLDVLFTKTCIMSRVMGGQTMTNDEKLLKISIAILEERVGELEHIVKRLHNTVHFQKKHSGEDGFGYWQVG